MAKILRKFSEHSCLYKGHMDLDDQCHLTRVLVIILFPEDSFHDSSSSFHPLGLVLALYGSHGDCMSPMGQASLFVPGLLWSALCWTMFSASESKLAR